MERRQPAHPPRDLSDQALGWIVRLNSGEATRADREAYRSWKALSRDHALAAAEAETLWDYASEIGRDPETGLIQPGTRRRRRASRRDALAVLAGLGLAGAGGVWLHRRQSLLPDHATGLAQTRTVVLPDGSRVTLNAMSAIGVDYSPQARQVVLIEGQAYFEVAADPSRPFEVRAGGIGVLALGTAFDVDRTLPGHALAVSVARHSVSVRRLDDAEPRQSPTIVREGERLVIPSAGPVGAPVPQDGSAVATWRDGIHVAENRRLEEVIAAFRPYHRGWIVIRDERLKALRVNAVLDLRTPEASLAALEGGLPIRVHMVSKYLTVITEY